MLFKAMVQAVLIFGSEMCVMTPCTYWDLGGILENGGHTDYSEANLADSERKLGVTSIIVVDAVGGF